MNTLTFKEVFQVVLVFIICSLMSGGFITYISDNLFLSIFIGMAVGLLCSFSFVASKD